MGIILLTISVSVSRPRMLKSFLGSDAFLVPSNTQAVLPKAYRVYVVPLLTYAY